MKLQSIYVWLACAVAIPPALVAQTPTPGGTQSQKGPTETPSGVAPLRSKNSRGLSVAIEEGYGLPVKLGLSSAEVRKILGPPTETWMNGEMVTLEWYYPHGIMGEFEHDRLSSVTLYKDTLYLGFIPYAGTIIKGIRLTDSKATVLKKLGTPSKVESGDLPAGTHPDDPVRWALDSRYNWEFKDYEAKATFLNQARTVGGGVVWPKDSLTEFTIQKLGRVEASHAEHH